VLIDYLLLNPGEKVGHNLQSLVKILKNDDKLNSWGLSGSLFTTFRQDDTGMELFIKILNEYTASQNPNAETICFKGTRVFESYEQVRSFCQSMEIQCDLIRVIRDPRAVFISQNKTFSPTTGKPMCQNPLDVARSWQNWLRSTSTLNSIVDIKFEDLVSYGDQEFLNLCNSLSLDFNVDNRNGTVYHRLNQKHKLIHSNLQYGLVKERVWAWGNEIDVYSKRIIESTCKFEMNKYGYLPQNTRINPIWYAIRLFIHRITSRYRFKLKSEINYFLR
jgi:hypothetical protein